MATGGVLSDSCVLDRGSDGRTRPGYRVRLTVSAMDSAVADEELSELAFKYYFTIPSYYILVMRSFVTLEGIALSADDDGSFNSACLQSRLLHRLHPPCLFLR